ncbi:MAG TPA: phage tail protein, partial [Blastocatellia bacterium]|nr:phage tail protein [Blastocatellia bacterium]
MNADNKANFSYLGDGGWAAFRWQGLEQIEDGSLRLHQLPLFESELPEGLADAAPPDGPAGIAVDSDGTIYFSDPSADRIRKVEGCFGEGSNVACIGGRGSAPSQFNSPRGLLIAKHRRSLFVADSGNHRVQVFDLRSLELVDIWGQLEVAGVPQPGSDDGLFNTPTALAADDHGNVYVVDYGNNRVQKFNRAGEVVPSFWQTMKQAGAVARPCDVAVYSDQQTTRVFVVDEASHKVFVFDADGRPARDRWDRHVSFGSKSLKKPLGIAAGGDVVYVGDNELRRVLTFKRRERGGYEYAGAAVNYKGSVAALAFDLSNDLLVHTGTSLAPLKLATKRGYATRGVLWSKPIRLRNFKVSWHRLQAVVESPAQGAHLRLFVHTSSSESSGPAVHPDDDNPFADPKWRPRSDGPDEFSDISDLFIGGESASFLWVGALFSGDGLGTPVVSQMRVEFDHDDYRQHLPEIYRDESPCGDFLPRFLSMFESLFGEVELKVENLSRLFDTAAAPAQFLPWLAGWLALELDEDWGEDEKRRRIA